MYESIRQVEDFELVPGLSIDVPDVELSAADGEILTCEFDFSDVVFSFVDKGIRLVKAPNIPAIKDMIRAALIDHFAYEAYAIEREQREGYAEEAMEYLG